MHRLQEGPLGNHDLDLLKGHLPLSLGVTGQSSHENDGIVVGRDHQTMFDFL